MSDAGRRIAGVVERIETALIALLVLAMVLLAGAQILLRNLLETGFAWSRPDLVSCTCATSPSTHATAAAWNS